MDKRKNGRQGRKGRDGGGRLGRRLSQIIQNGARSITAKFKLLFFFFRKMDLRQLLKNVLLALKVNE